MKNVSRKLVVLLSHCHGTYKHAQAHPNLDVKIIDRHGQSHEQTVIRQTDGQTARFQDIAHTPR